MRQVKVNATPFQAAFLNLTCRYPAFSGGYGSGKTHTLILSAILDASHAPDALIAIYAPTYSDIRLTIAPRLEEKLHYFKIPYEYNRSEQIIKTLHPQFGNFIMKSLDNPDGIIGYQVYRSHIDELDTLTLQKAKSSWIKILGRNRQIPTGFIKETVKNRISVYSTPEGYNFLYDMWVKNKPSDEYQLIKAKSESNPYLQESYIKALKETYSGELVKAYLDGEFVNLTSGTVYYSYNRQDHTSTENIRKHDTLYIGMDFNVSKQCATVFVKRRDGWHAVDELVNMFDTPEAIDIIKERYGNDRNIYIYPDASGGSRKSVGASVNDISLLRAAGFAIRANKSNPRVKDRVLATNTAFKNNKVFINPFNCPNTCECLEQQAYDSNGQPDKKSDKDHQNDATTYFICYEMPLKGRAFEANVDFYNGYRK